MGASTTTSTSASSRCKSIKRAARGGGGDGGGPMSPVVQLYGSSGGPCGVRVWAQPGHLRSVRLGGDPAAPPLVAVDFRDPAEVSAAEEALRRAASGELSQAADPRYLRLGPAHNAVR